MSKVNRNCPVRSTASEARYSIFEFDQEFPDDASCLDFLVGKLYPDGIFCPTCKKVTKHHRETNRPSYACQYCGHHEHPLKGTIFQGSATSLRLWFYGIYLMASTRCGISAKQLERELGVTYKTAWRMFKQIRSLLGQDIDKFTGRVEIDEAYIGGQAKWRSRARSKRRGVKHGRGGANTPVLGVAQRRTEKAYGKVYIQIADGVGADEILPTATTKILPGTSIYTDEWGPYKPLRKLGYEHKRIHHAQGVYVDGDVHTNTIEGFFALVKSGIRGTYHAVSTKHLQSYLDEYAFRYNNRGAIGRGMVDAFFSRIGKASPSLPPAPEDR